MQLIMPKLGLTMTEGTITEWLKAPGQAVKSGEVLFTYETEKVSLEYEAPADGRLSQILVPAGATVPVGMPVCEFQAAGDAPAAEPEAQHGQAPGTEDAAAGPTEAAPVAPDPGGRIEATPKARTLAAQWGIELAGLPGRGPGGRIQAADVEERHAAMLATEPAIKATPVARRVATVEGVDLSQVPGTGPSGRVTKADVERAAAGAQQAAVLPAAAPAAPAPAVSPLPPAATETIVPLTGVRQIIAQRMSQSAFTAPHVTCFTEADATELVAVRDQLNQDLPAAEKISYNALLAAITAHALREYPALNARLEPDGIHLLPDINIALAVDTDRGLTTPVLRQVDRQGLRAIQAGYAALIEAALSNRGQPDDYNGGTFTISNLGSLEIDGFTPIINPPQAAILGVGRILEKPVLRAGAVVARSMVVLSLSFDHRIVDGAPAARFLQRIKQLVEKPLSLLL